MQCLEFTAVQKVSCGTALQQSGPATPNFLHVENSDHLSELLHYWNSVLIASYLRQVKQRSVWWRYETLLRVKHVATF